MAETGHLAWAQQRAAIGIVRNAPYSIHKSLGEGDDLRFDSTPNLAGGALLARERVVHLCVFVSAERQGHGGGSVRSSNTVRRRYRNVA